MTKQRSIIYDIIQRTPGHLTAEQIFFLAKKEIPSLAIGTVYRNLNLMVDEGVIRRVSVQGSPDCFDKVLQSHDHLVCKECGDLSDVFLPELQPELERRIGFPIDSYDLNIRYVCPKCARKHEESAQKH